MTNTEEEAIYKPSWIDRFNNWVDDLPVHAWIFYVVFGLGLILIQLLFLWLDGGLTAEEIMPVVIFNGLAVPYLLALIHLNDKLAVIALGDMRTVLDMTTQEVDHCKYRLSTMPFLRPLLAGLALTILTILTPLISTTPIRYAALEQLPVFSVVFHIVDKSSAFLFGVVLYHTIRQLRLVNVITSHHVQVNLYHLKPFQAFSRVTAATALGLLVFVYLWMIINPELLADPLLLGYVLIFTILAISVFIWPLWGAHRLMQLEKGKVLTELDHRFEAIFLKFNQLLNDEDYPAAEKLSGTIASLEIEYKRIRDIPTWPWSTETARIVLTAIALPLMLMIIQFFVLQALGQ